jgi:hypothetical protein
MSLSWYSSQRNSPSRRCPELWHSQFPALGSSANILARKVLLHRGWFSQHPDHQRCYRCPPQRQSAKYETRDGNNHPQLSEIYVTSKIVLPLLHQSQYNCDRSARNGCEYFLTCWMLMRWVFQEACLARPRVSISRPLNVVSCLILLLTGEWWRVYLNC